MRSNIEKYISYIAKGTATYEDVVSHSLDVFKEKFLYFVRKVHVFRCNVEQVADSAGQMERMDQLFEASFSTLSETTGKFRSKCGKCNRYMKFIPLKCVAR